MKTWTKVGIGFLALLLILATTLISSVIGINNDLVQQESGIVAQYKQNQNNYDNYLKKLQEAAQVPSMYTDDLKNVYKETLAGRYGAQGSKAVFQFIKEHNPNFDSKLYTQLQQIVESGRNSFEVDQKTLLDKRRVYEISLNTFPQGLVAKLLAFPRIELAKYDIVTSDSTTKAFDDKKSDPIKLR